MAVLRTAKTPCQSDGVFGQRRLQYQGTVQVFCDPVENNPEKPYRGTRRVWIKEKVFRLWIQTVNFIFNFLSKKKIFFNFLQLNFMRNFFFFFFQRSGSPNGRTGSAGSGPTQQVLAAQGTSVVAVAEEVKSKPRSRSLIRRASRKTKQQIRESHADDCNIS